MKIEICKNYPKSKDLYKLLSLAFPSVNIYKKSCIGMCKKCTEQPVVKINKNKIKAKNLKNIVKSIKEKGVNK